MTTGFWSLSGLAAYTVSLVDCWSFQREIWLIDLWVTSFADVKAALEYSKLLKTYADESKDDLHIVCPLFLREY